MCQYGIQQEEKLMLELMQLNMAEWQKRTDRLDKKNASSSPTGTVGKIGECGELFYRQRSLTSIAEVKSRKVSVSEKSFKK